MGLTGSRWLMHFSLLSDLVRLRSEGSRTSQILGVGIFHYLPLRFGGLICFEMTDQRRCVLRDDR